MTLREMCMYESMYVCMHVCVCMCVSLCDCGIYVLINLLFVSSSHLHVAFPFPSVIREYI